MIDVLRGGALLVSASLLLVGCRQGHASPPRRPAPADAVTGAAAPGAREPSPAPARVVAPGGWETYDEATSGRVTVRALEAPPLEHTLRTPAPIARPGPPPALIKRLEERNGITDDDAWLRKNGLTLPPSPLRGPSRALDPASAPPRYTLEASSPTTFGVFDPDGKLVSAFDFASYSGDGGSSFTGQSLVWAAVESGVLFVSHRHMTYAASSGGMNAYVTALDLRTGSLLWRSDPLVSNGNNFLLRGGYVICGYGFTAEKDHLFVLDASTGEVVRKIALRSGPDWLIEKDGKLFVRTYDTNYVFDLGAPPRPPHGEAATTGAGPGSSN